MALKEFSRLTTQLLRNKVCLYTAVRCSSDTPAPWNYLWRPGTYSKKDHDKIAEKYHLHPKEYQPYSPSEEKYLGDYPKLPMVGPAAKDPYYPYDIPTFRKNYHETLHNQFEIMGEDRYSYGYNYRIDPILASGIFLATMLTLAVINYLTEPYPTVHPRVGTPNGVFSVDDYKSVMERQFPQKDVVHYTFEPADS